MRFAPETPCPRTSGLPGLDLEIVRHQNKDSKFRVCPFTLRQGFALLVLHSAFISRSVEDSRCLSIEVCRGLSRSVEVCRGLSRSVDAQPGVLLSCAVLAPLLSLMN